MEILLLEAAVPRKLFLRAVAPAAALELLGCAGTACGALLSSCFSEEIAA